MADNGEAQADQPQDEQQGSARKAARKATKKTTAKRTAKKTAAKKTASKANKRAAARAGSTSVSKTGATKTDAAENGAAKSGKGAAKQGEKAGVAKQQAPNPFANFDRAQLGEKTRVFQLAKQLGVPSKELIVALSELGVVKVAQSSLTRAESEQLLDALAGRSAEPEPDAADEKIRDRVRKDVANEITQIERKVEEELSDRAEEGFELDDATDDTDALTDPEDIEAPLTDVEPDVTPAPEEPAAYTPLFKAPSRSGRRRASRPSGGSASEETSPAKPAGAAAPAGAVSDALDTAAGAGGHAARDAGDAGADVTEGAVEVLHEPKAIKGSSRLEAQRRRRSEKREEERKRSRIVSQAEFLARRESVTRTMVVRERDRHHGVGKITQVGVLEDGLLVEHFVTSDQQASMIGNIYLGRVQNVLPSMEAAFIDIGQGRNGVLYAGEVDWKAAGLGGRSRRIEHALKSGDQVVVQVTKDPVGHKGARLTTQISLAGRFLVYVPGGRSAGISRKLPAQERKRLKEILNNVVPGKGGAIIRTAAEGVPEEAIAADVRRLHTQWETIQELADKHQRSKGAKPVTLYEEPNLLVKVVRDLFNEDFSALIVDGKKPWNTVNSYVQSVAPELADRLERFDRNEHGGKDAFEVYRVDEQIQKALARSVWLPSGGSLVIDRTEAMTVIDVNTGKFTGAGGSLEETVTANNLEAAEEIVRQIRLRDIGGIIIIDFIDMILPENQDLVLRRLKEALGRDRTRHQVSEVTSLGLVQMTRKRLGTGLLETFSEPCECCGGRGIILADDPIEHEGAFGPFDRPQHGGQQEHRGNKKSEREGGAGAERAGAWHEAERAEAGRADTEHAEAGRAAGARAKASAHLDDAELDEIAGSVIAGQREARDGEESQERRGGREGHEGGDNERRSRRRGRRGGSRGRGRQAQADAQAEDRRDHRDRDDLNDRTDHENRRDHRDRDDLNDRPDQDNRRDHRDRDDLNDRNDDRGAREDVEQRYEQAVEEFEASPRRKRRTRGNSRSDQRPRREDFVDDTQRSGTREDSNGGTRGGIHEGADAERGAEREAERGTDRSKDRSEARGGRGRRRATRKSNASATQAQEPVKAPATDPASRSAGTEASGPGEAERTRAKRRQASERETRSGDGSHSGARRGRRRATRRGTAN